MTFDPWDKPCIVEGCSERAHIFGVDDVNLCDLHMDQLEEWNRALDDQATAAAGGPESMSCPRRMNELGGWDREEGMDAWEMRHDYRNRRARRCSFCGSLHPDDFMDRVRAGEELGPTDKSYKVYMADHAKFYFQHLSVDQRREFVELWNTNVMKVGYPGHFYSPPFFMKPVT